MIPTSNLQITSRPGNYKVQVGTNGMATLVNASGGAGQVNNVTADRAFNTAYQNNYGQSILVTGWGTTSGSSVGNITTAVGETAGSVESVWSDEATATESGGAKGFICGVPAGYWYSLIPAGAVTGLAKVVETLI